MKAIQEAVRNLALSKQLSEEIARKALREIIEGEAPEVLVAGLLVGLHARGETAEEIAAIAKEVLEHAVRLDLNADKLLDTCGSGGDGYNTFNISTASAFVCAACGVKVAKHGNRSVSSVSGSADVLEALGARVELNPDEAKKVFDETGITFLFAPLYHPGLRNVAPVRKALSSRTVFNFIGPLVNPANANYRVLGVSSADYAEKIADVLVSLGIKRAVVINAEDGLDEFSLKAKNRIFEVCEGAKKEYFLTAEDLNLSPADYSEIQVRTPEESAHIILSVFKGEKNVCRWYVVANASFGLYVTGMAETPARGVLMAEEAIDSGNALKKLEEFVKATGGKVVVS